MKTIQVEGNDIELTELGFLQDRLLWNEKVAIALAEKVGIKLTQEHWQVIDFTRNFYQKFQIIPSLRIFIKNLREEFGSELGNSVTLHKLFPESPLKYICMIGGLPKPKHCI